MHTQEDKRYKDFMDRDWNKRKADDAVRLNKLFDEAVDKQMEDNEYRLGYMQNRGAA